MIASILYAVAVVSGGGQAASAKTPAAAPTTAAPPIERFGDWSLACADRPGIPPCEVVQAVQRKDSAEQVLRFSIAYAGSGDRYAVQFQVPLGILVQGDVLVRLDDKTDLPGYRVTRCEAEGCFVERLVERKALDPFFAATKGLLAVPDRAGKPLVLPLSFNGFSQAMTAMRERNQAWAARQPAAAAAPSKPAASSSPQPTESRK